MKKLFVLALVILLAVGKCVSQPLAYFTDYSNPSKPTLLAFFKGDTEKDIACRVYLIKAANVKLKGDTVLSNSKAAVNYLFNNLHWEEVQLTEGGFINSAYDATTGKVVPSMGHAWQGMAWVFRAIINGKLVTFVLIKGDCGNTVFIPSTPAPAPAPKKDSIIYKIVVDTIRYKIPTVENTERNVVNYTPAGKSSFPAYGEDGVNVWNYTPSGWNHQQPLSGGLNVNAQTQGGNTTPQNISGGNNTNNTTNGGTTPSQDISGGHNVVNTTQGGTYGGCKKF